MVQIAPRTRIDRDMAEVAEELLLAKEGPKAVARALAQTFPNRRQPSLRWIKARSAALKAEPSEPWSFIDALPEEAAVVLPVLGAVMRRTGRRTRHVTRAEARMLRKVVAAVPDVPPWVAYLLARQFLVATPDEANLLVEYMADAPWRRGVTRYETAAEAVGLIPHEAEGSER